MIKSKRTKLRPGRLKGEAMTELRMQCFDRDVYCCQHMLKYEDGTDMARCGWGITWESGHMAHIVSRGRGGKDELSNVITKCAQHHMIVEHSYGPSGIKPCPSKQIVYETPDAGLEPWAKDSEK